MVELMAVLIILGLLFALVAKNYVGQTDRARVITTKTNLKLLHSAVNEFKMDTGRFPTEDEGLKALVERPTDVQNWPPGGYIETTDIPTDGWGREFIYRLAPENDKPFVVISLGADGQEGGEGYDSDLLSTDAN
jgi:general secretion pathway protein G